MLLKVAASKLWGRFIRVGIEENRKVIKRILRAVCWNNFWNSIAIQLELNKTTKISIFRELLGQTATLVHFGSLNLFQSTLLKKEKKIFTSECCQNFRHVVMTCCPTKKFGWLVIQHVIRYEITLIPTRDSMAKNYNMSFRWQCCEKCHPCLDLPSKFG